MKRSSLATAILATFCAAGVVHAEEAAAPSGPLSAENFTSTVRLTTDYRARGISNSDGPAIQGSLDWGYNGFFLGAWASNTEFSDANIEMDFYGGYKFAAAGLNFTLQGIYYAFPGEDSKASEGYDPPGFDPALGRSTFPDPSDPTLYANPSTTHVQPYLGQLPDIEADYFEVNLGVAKTFDVALKPTISFNYHYSPDYFGEDGNSHHFGGSLGFTLPMGISPYIMGGYQTVEGDEYSAYFGTPDGYDWEYFQVGATYPVLGFTLDLSYVWSTEGGDCGGAGQPLCNFNGGFETFYNNYSYASEGGGSYKDLTDDAVVFSIYRTF
jgi:hypothetical protein